MKSGQEQTAIFQGVCETDKNTEEYPLKQTKPLKSSWWKNVTSHFSPFCPIFCKIYELKQQTAEMQTQQGSNWGEYSEKSKRVSRLVE